MESPNKFVIKSQGNMAVPRDAYNRFGRREKETWRYRMPTGYSRAAEAKGYGPMLQQQRSETWVVEGCEHDLGNAPVAYMKQSLGCLLPKFENIQIGIVGL
ncbi:hypothetical protein L6452_03489 [Arctium lappa]|uniref:Uncharacterized protein n=1 Tax=Arctium lappa TaxID=4217 RepID=A0ACB9FMB0_ARCLA|nr:hypothetical protein L6452_03489 [Arctium lappa]